MPAHPVPDQLVGGRYVWREGLGRGGFGVVWRAHDTLLQRDVAVKVIEFPTVLDYAERAAIRKKVLREARAAARLSHPGLVTVFDVVEEDGRPLIVMELVKAPTLAELVAREGPLSEERAAAVGLEVLDALSAAHARGIIHRDIKPANVMVSESGHVQVTDFGIASIIDDPKVTSSGSLAGSPAYMAPEQARNLPPSAATDLWGLGATLWFAVEGRPPFQEKGAIATMTAVVHGSPQPLDRADRLAPLLVELLAKEPSARPSTAEVRRRLGQVAAPAADADGSSTMELDPRRDWTDASPATTARADEAALPTPVEPPPLVTPPPAPAEEQVATQRAEVPPAPPEARPRPAPPRRPGRAPRRPGIVVGVAAAAVLAVVAVALLAGRGGESSSTRSPATTAGQSSANGSPNPTSPAAGRSGNVPKDWVVYRDPSTGYSIAHPPGWTMQSSGTITDFRDPESGAYLRVDHREPPGPSPEGAWYDFEPSFAAQNANYHRIQITPTTYNGYRAATWEYTYSARGADLHAVDLGFIAGAHGFALNFQTTGADWNRLQPVFDGFKASFKAP
jgi:serine/threonine protein kinase